MRPIFAIPAPRKTRLTAATMGLSPLSPARLEERLGYNFRSLALLDEAVRHPSVSSMEKHAVTNQRLEFLGDAVLQLVISEKLYEIEPKAREGVLSRKRSSLTKGRFLSVLARELGLDRELVMSPAEELAGGRDRAAALEDAFEALVGAVYLDGGLDAVRTAVLRWYGPLPVRLADLEHADNPKGRLQELVQPDHGNSALRYEVIETTGEDHCRRFSVNVHFLDRVVGTGSGTSKKEAEENAARAALDQWKTSAPN